MQHLEPQIKNFDKPDEQLHLDGGLADTVIIGDLVVGCMVMEPGLALVGTSP